MIGAHCLRRMALLAVFVSPLAFGQLSDFLPKPPRDQRPDRAQVAFEAGDYAKAADLWAAYVRDNPENAEAWLFLGWSHYRMSNFEEARVAFERSERADPDSTDAKVALGFVELQTSEPAIAARHFREVLAEHPERIDALEGLVLASRRPNAPDDVVQAGMEAASRLENQLGKDIEVLLASTTLEAGKERRFETDPLEGPMRVPFRAGEHYLQIRQGDSWRPVFVKGLNLGPALPGRFAASAPTAQETYRQWLEEIAALGANSVRLYTILPPGFYQALAWHNNQPDKSTLWLIQEVWTELPSQHDFSDPTYVRAVQTEIRRTIDVIHGNIAIGPRRSHSWGAYDADVSPYVLAYIIGPSWNASAVEEYNRMYPDRKWEGRWFSVSGGGAMESWLAEMCEFAAEYEATQYRMLHPLSVANWPELAPLGLSRRTQGPEAQGETAGALAMEGAELPQQEPAPSEAPGAEATADQSAALAAEPEPEPGVAIDTTVIRPTEAMSAGFFAAYHVYPHALKAPTDTTEDRRYAAYLRDLKAYHGTQPLLVAEFGVSTSRGIANPQHEGLHHGGHEERRQGELVSQMMRDIFETKLAGGIIFEFMDEWFKTTWNVASFEVPEDRRQLWFNAESPEQSYGLMAVRPAAVVIEVDGELSDWSEIPPYASD